MAIDAMQRKAMAAGTIVTAKYKGAEHVAEVVTGEDGKIRYRLADGREFKSPSAAASAVMGGMAANGWRFWTVEGAEPTKAATRAVKPSTAPAAEAGDTDAQDASTPRPRPQCTRCGKTFVGEAQLAHHDANADRLCTPE